MKVKFIPQNVEFEIEPGKSVLHIAQDHQIHIKSVCRGVPSCAECRVRVVEGESNVIPPASQELGLIGTAWFVDQRRLSCQLRCFGNITVDLTEQIEKAETAGKKPRGKYNKDELQESRAVMGNLVMKDEDEDASAPSIKPVAVSASPVVGRDEESDEDFGDDEAGDEGEEAGPGAGDPRAAGSGAGPDGKKRRRRRGRRGKRRGGGGGPPPAAQ